MTNSKEEIFAEVKAIIVKLFGTDPDKITLEASIFEDLDLDSIDAVDMVVQLQQRIGRKVSPQDFRQVRTVQDVVDIVYKLINEPNGTTSAAGSSADNGNNIADNNAATKNQAQ